MGWSWRGGSLSDDEKSPFEAREREGVSECLKESWQVWAGPGTQAWLC